MLRRLSISLILVVLGCSTKTGTTSDQTPANEQYFRARFNGDSLVRFHNFSDGIDLGDQAETDSSNIAHLLFANYIQPYGRTQVVIRNIKPVFEGPIFSLGATSIFAIRLSEDLPTTWPVHSLLVLSKDLKEMFLLRLESFEPIKLNARSAPLLAGRRVNRGVGDFAVFKITHDTLFSVFESEVVCDYLDGCNRIQDHNLRLENIDLNGDGLLDLRFTGKMYYYCKGESSEPESEVAIDSAELSYIYLAEVDSKGIVQWRR